MYNSLYYYHASPIHISGQTPVASSDSADKISSFAHLPEGWDYGSGGPIEAATIHAAKMWDGILRGFGFWDTDAFAGGSGEILIAGSQGDHYVELIVEPDCKLSIGYDFRNKQVFYRSNMTSLEALQTISELVGHQTWNAYGYYTQVSSTRKRINLRGLRSETLGTMDVYPSSMQAVLSQQAHHVATTYEDIISHSPESLGNLRFSGDLNPMLFSLRVTA